MNLRVRCNQSFSHRYLLSRRCRRRYSAWERLEQVSGFLAVVAAALAFIVVGVWL